MVKCKNSGCKKDAYYGYVYKEPVACPEHRIFEPKMVEVARKRCEGCKISSALAYGLEGKIPTHCFKCKTDVMVNLKFKLCIKCNKVRPSYGLDQTKDPTHCKTCATDDMKNAKHKLCEKCNKTRPSYGVDIDKPATHCAKCKDNTMIYTGKMCQKCNLVSPSFALDTDKTPTHCNNCKTEDMKSVHKSCTKCKKARAYYGLDDKAEYCADCATVDMINVSSKKCVKCKIKQPHFGFEGKSATHCKTCSESTMINVKARVCKTVMCGIEVSDKYDGYCSRCYAYMNPDTPPAYNYKTKEKAVVNYIIDEFKDYNWIWDKKIKDGLSQRRPDLFLDLENQVIIIEINENKHQTYDCICENKRSMQLSQDVKHKPIVLINFNPDSYIDKDKNKILSPWSLTPKKKLLKVSNKIEWNNRLENLKEQVNYWIANNTDKTLEPIELYYNQNIKNKL